MNSEGKIIMERQKIHSMIITGCTILLIIIILFVYYITKQPNEILAGTDSSTVTDTKEEVVLQDTRPYFCPEEDYNYDFFEKSAEELYEEWFTCTEEETEYYHYYIKDGILYLDEYAETGEQDENGLCIYEWKMEQKIAENVIFIDYNWYGNKGNALYITEDHVLHGTGKYEEIHLENVKYARGYADQLLALTLDGKLWCGGKAFCIGEDQELIYGNWELVMQNVVFANLAHYRYMAITEDSSLYMWGDNSLGQFGDGSLLRSSSEFDADCYFYQKPVKVAEGIKMVWEGHPGNPTTTAEYGELRTYFLTEQNQLFVCGEKVGDEMRPFIYFGELGILDEPLSENCTSTLHKVVQ